MKLLLIAHTADNLPNVPKEIQNVVNALPVKLLINPTGSDIFNTVSEISSVEGVWISSHLDESGIKINNDEYLSIDNFAYFMRVMRPKWILFNGCNSYHILHTLQQILDADIIIPRSQQLDDRYAMNVASLLAIEYARQGDIRKAVQRLSPTGDVYEYHPSIQSTNDKQIIKESSAIMSSLERNRGERAELKNEISQVKECVEITDAKVSKFQETFTELNERINDYVKIAIAVYGILGLLYIITLIVNVIILLRT